MVTEDINCTRIPDHGNRRYGLVQGYQTRVIRDVNCTRIPDQGNRRYQLYRDVRPG